MKRWAWASGALALAFGAAAVNWFVGPEATGTMSGWPLGTGSLAYPWVKGTQDVMVAVLLGLFTGLGDRRGALVGVGAALVTVTTDIGFTLAVSGTTGLTPHVIYLGLTLAAGAVFFSEQHPRVQGEPLVRRG
ncbi:MAG: hypothetical protein MUC96_13855 [Myxococcaceae bacterium]|jgi:hypothetical protein|nr:hypothetical protein [Myxococcaceae bacterium]